MTDPARMIEFAESQLELQPHVVAWRLGAQMFGYDSRHMPEPIGLVVGEAPGRNTNPRLPLFPHPETSSGARLLGYGNVPYEDYLGKLVRVNLDEWGEATDEEKRERSRILLEGAADRRLRILLLGREVRDVFGCTQEFGRARLNASCERLVEVGWIPHPSGLNRRYNDFVAQEMAGIYVRWAMGGREP